MNTEKLRLFSQWLAEFGINFPKPITLTLEQVRPELEARGYTIHISARSYLGQPMMEVIKYGKKWFGLQRRVVTQVTSVFPIQLSWYAAYDEQTGEVVFSASQTQAGGYVKGLTYAKYGADDIRVKLPIKLVREDHGAEDPYTQDWVPHYLYREA